jgi:hypothetical protein
MHDKCEINLIYQLRINFLFLWYRLGSQVYQCFVRTYYLHLQGCRVSQANIQRSPCCLLDLLFTLKMETVHPSKMMVNVYQTTRCHIQEDHSSHLTLLGAYSWDENTCKHQIYWNSLKYSSTTDSIQNPIIYTNTKGPQLVKHHVTKIHRGMEEIQVFLASTLDEGMWPASHLGHYPWEKRTQYLLDRWQGRPRSPFGCCGEEKNLLHLSRIKPWFLGCPVSSLLLYWLNYPSLSFTLTGS